MATNPLAPNLAPSRVLAAVAGAVAVVTLMLAATIGLAPTAYAQSDTPTTQAVSDGDSPIGNILPRPNSGVAPNSANDPGGWQQYMVFALIGLGLVGIVALATRESRRIRRAQNTCPSRLLRTMPTLGRKPSGSITPRTPEHVASHVTQGR